MYIFSVAEFADSPYPTGFLADAQARGITIWAQRAAENNGNFKNFKFKTFEYKYVFAYHVFALLWNTQFIIYFTYLVIAGAIAQWYFTPRSKGREGEKIRGEGPNELSRSPVWASVKRTVFFHMGTVAFASLIVSMCEALRYTVIYIADKAKGDDPNCLQKCILGTTSCCLKCVTCCLEKISKTALVWTAIWGDSFLVASCSSFQFVWNNLSRVAAINLVSGFLMMLGKVLVALLCTGGVAMYIQTFMDDEISSIIMPCLVTFVLCYVAATLFMVIFEVCIDCIFLCFLVDEKHFAGSDKMYASKELEAVVNRYRPQSEKRAEKMKARAINAMEKKANAAAVPAGDVEAVALKN
jgi:hypothetical protein